MIIDILIFAAIAAFLWYRLNSVLGTRHGGENPRRNPFDTTPPQDRPARHTIDAEPVAAAAPAALAPAAIATLLDEKANAGGRIENGLADIAAADPAFSLTGFMQGARAAFEMIVTAYSRGDLETLKPLLSPKLFADFAAGIAAREQAGHTNELTIHRIKSARVVEAHLGGTMAYVTVDFDVEETSVTRDRAGAIVEGDPDSISSVEDIWTFTRDTRADDPNWVLIETRAAEK